MLMPIPNADEVGQELVDLSVFVHVLTKRSFGGPCEQQSPDGLVASYERHNVAVRAGVPADRLLEHDVTQGWEPLCGFLGLPVPDRPMPRTNDRRALS